MIKKRYGSVLLARFNSTQKVELITKLIAHNLDRYVELGMCYLLRVSAEPGIINILKGETS